MDGAPLPIWVQPGTMRGDEAVEEPGPPAAADEAAAARFELEVVEAGRAGAGRVAGGAAQLAGGGVVEVDLGDRGAGGAVAVVVAGGPGLGHQLEPVAVGGDAGGLPLQQREPVMFVAGGEAGDEGGGAVFEQVEVWLAGLGRFFAAAVFDRVGGQDAVGDEVEAGAVGGGAEDATLDFGGFTSLLGSEVGELAGVVAGARFDDAAFVEVRPLVAGFGVGAGVGGQRLGVGEEDAGAVGGHELVLAAAGDAGAALFFVELDRAGPAGFVAFAGGAGGRWRRGGGRGHCPGLPRRRGSRRRRSRRGRPGLRGRSWLRPLRRRGAG